MQETATTPIPPDETSRAVAAGIRLCRRGQWQRGLPILVAVAESAARPGELPGLFYSYLGYGLARHQDRVGEGLRLCRHAVKREFWQPENHLNLARTQLIASNRRGAVEAVAAGLRVHDEHPVLNDLRAALGVRRRPVLPFLERAHPVNRWLGTLRHRMSGSPPSP